MCKAIFIYDNDGNIFNWSIGEPFNIPNGLPYLIVDDYNYEKRAIVKIDVTQTPHVPIYSHTEEEIEEKEMITASTPTNFELAEASMETAQAVSDVAEAIDVLAEMLVMVEQRLTIIEENLKEG